MQKRDEEGLAGERYPGLFDRERGGGEGEHRRKGLRVHVDADADNDETDAGGFGLHFGQDTAELARAGEQVVGPAEIRVEAGYGVNGGLRGEPGGE